MTLTLLIRNAATLENGMPTEFVLHQRGATIGRGTTCDWCLPDPHRHISSRHCEISFRDRSYWLTDTSTNGTFVNDSTERLLGEHEIQHGDLVVIGEFEITAELSGSEVAADVSESTANDASKGWNSWTDTAPPASDETGQNEWGEPQDLPAFGHGSQQSKVGGGATPAVASNISGATGGAPAGGFGWGKSRPVAEETPGQDGWVPTQDASDMPDGASVWLGPQSQPDPSSGWSSAANDRPAEATPGDIWGQIAEDNVVDWARGGFGSPVERPIDPLGLEEDNSISAEPLRSPAEVPEEVAVTPAPARRRSRPPAKGTRTPPAAAPAAPGSAGSDSERLLTEFLAAACLSMEHVKDSPDQTFARAGGLLRRLVAGLVVLVEARARAKSQMGAESTRLELEGNNPIKFARSPEQALAQLLVPPERGFMHPEQAIDEAFYDLQSHQMATLKAMQGALRATLDRFSPNAIRNRAETGGFLESILPAARDSALWRAYEREFSGVAQGSDEAFMDVFAKEFRKAYEEQSQIVRQSPAR